MVQSSHFYEFIGLTCFFASIFCRIEWGRRWRPLVLGEIFEITGKRRSRVILKKKTRSRCVYTERQSCVTENGLGSQDISRLNAQAR